MEHEHLEHVEHHSEHAHSPFDRRVAMTMAIVAAVLCCVTLLSHRAHNDTLRLQAESNRLQTQANIQHTKASDQWSYFQAKKNRQYQYEALVDLPIVLATTPAPNGPSNPEGNKRVEDWKARITQYKKDSKEIEDKAREHVKEAEELQDQAKERLEDSHRAHHRADRFDYGELGVELALVLCSVAVLTKRSGFWYGGLVSGLIGGIVAATGFLLH